MSDRIVVAGDVHLGAERADVDAFGGFLEERYRERTTIDHLVLIGDVWDLVRRDPFGCAWETSETISCLKRFAADVSTYVVFGNHDSHLRNLDAALYDVEFRDELVLQSGESTVRFCHGNSFDWLQSDVVSDRLSGPGDRGDIDPTRGAKDPVVAGARRVVRRGRRRLGDLFGGLTSRDTSGAYSEGDPTEDRSRPTSRSYYPRRERRAHAFLDRIPEDKLVYGHTHSPYVRRDNRAANPGSWTSTAPIHNTYLVVEAGEIELYRHHDGRPDERLTVGTDGDVRPVGEARRVCGDDNPIDGSD